MEGEEHPWPGDPYSQYKRAPWEYDHDLTIRDIGMPRPEKCTDDELLTNPKYDQTGSPRIDDSGLGDTPGYWKKYEDDS